MTIYKNSTLNSLMEDKKPFLKERLTSKVLTEISYLLQHPLEVMESYQLVDALLKN